MQNALGCHGDRGLLSSLVGWIAGNATPSFIEGQSLCAEVRYPKAPAVCARPEALISRTLSPDALGVVCVSVGVVHLDGAEYGGRV